ncbi:MAG: D-aminoacyl-tRNA deacylase [Candidatus Omnitrophica bacterium]|nr:D-aminoacyl-tRNA deacylase [Candidatus Omnitrophota bacterium]
MYNKYLIVASKQDKAGTGITTALSQFRKNPLITSMSKDAKGFDFYLIETEIIEDSGVDYEKLKPYDFIIFASKHQSEKGEKSLSVHAPGNWLSTEPKFGGEKQKVCPTSALFQKQLFENLNKVSKEHELDEKYNITLECTHHGPLIDKPCIFIEIGSSETEWNDRKAAFVVAKTISETIETFKENPYNEVAIGIGGPHYCPNFNKIQLNSNIAISHIIPQYVLPLKLEMVKQAIEKTSEEVDFAVLDWKGLGNAEQRQEIIKILEDNYVKYKRTSDVDK